MVCLNVKLLNNRDTSYLYAPLSFITQ